MSNKQTTAVEWLFDKLNNSKCWADPIQCSELFAEAKAIERKQIEDAYKEAACNILGEEVCPIDECNAAWEYFEDTYTQ